MNRDVEIALESKGFTYKGNDTRVSTGEEVTFWLCPDGTKIAIIIIEGEEF